MNKLYKILISFSLLVILGTTLFGKLIINILFGSEFIQAYNPLLISIWALLFVSIGVARNSFIMSKNLNKLYFYTTVIGALLNIVLNFILLRAMGVIGASIATFISYFVSAHISSVFFSKLRSQFHVVNKVVLNLITFNLYK